MEQYFTIVYHYSDNCNVADKLLFEHVIPRMYNIAADLFNKQVDDFNREWDIRYPDADRPMTDENGWLPKYNKFIAKKMRPLCATTSKTNNFVGVRPDEDAWYEFYLKRNKTKTATFSLKPVEGS